MGQWHIHRYIISEIDHKYLRTPSTRSYLASYSIPVETYSMKIYGPLRYLQVVYQEPFSLFEKAKSHPMTSSLSSYSLKLGYISPEELPFVHWANMYLTPLFKMKIFNPLRPGQNGRHFADDIFKYKFLNENAWISMKISLKFVPKGPINKIPAFVQIMAWRRSGDKPLS